MADSGTRTYKAPSATSTPGAAARPRGNGGMKGSAGRQGCGLAEMTKRRSADSPGFTITTEACNDYFAAGKKLPAGLWDDVLGGGQGRRAANRQGPRRSREPASGVRPLRRQVQYAGHDGHRPQPRPQRGVPSGPHRDHRNERFGWDAYRRFISMFGRIVLDVPTRSLKSKDGSLVEYNRFDEALDAAKARHGKDAKDTDLDVRGPQGPRRHLQEDRPRHHRPRLPGRSERAAGPGHQGRLRLVVRQARQRLPQQPEDPPRPRHRASTS